MPNDKYQELLELNEKVIKAEKKLTSLRGRLRQTELKLNIAKRSYSDDLKKISQEYDELIGKVKDASLTFQQFRIASKLKAQEITDDPEFDPEKVITNFDAKIPTLLFPVHLETRFVRESMELWVRIYPDDISIETHENGLTLEEYEAGRVYFTEKWKSEALEYGDNNEEADRRHRLAWASLAGEFGSNRAAWITKIFENAETGSYIVDWPDHTEEATGPTFKNYDDPDVNKRPDSWSEAPKSRTMPDQFGIRLYRKGFLYKQVWTNLIPDPLVVGPVPYPSDENGLRLFWLPLTQDIIDDLHADPIILSDDIKQGFIDIDKKLTDSVEIIISEEQRWTILDRKKETKYEAILDTDNDKIYIYSEEELFDEESAWLEDFDRAIEMGMGIKIDISDLTEDEMNEGFSHVIALGIKSTQENKHLELIEKLVDNHHYTEGFTFLKQGTPTNNTVDAKSDFTDADTDFDSTFDIEISDMHQLDVDDDKFKCMAGGLFSEATGTGADFLKNIRNTGLKENDNAMKMRQALWPVTWLYYFNKIITHKTFLLYLDYLNYHFINHVSPSGPYPAFRVSNIPYGILPTTAFSRLVIADSDLSSSDLDTKKQEDEKSFLNGLYKLLILFYKHWKAIAEKSMEVPIIGKSNDPEKEFLSIIGMDGLSYPPRFRPYSRQEYVNTLIDFLSNELTASDPLTKYLPTTTNVTSNWVSSQEFFTSRTDASDVLLKIQETLSAAHPLHSSIELYQPWGDSFDPETPLVHKSENKDIPIPALSKLDNKNYLQWLASSDLATILNDKEIMPSNSLLYTLLRRGILFEEYGKTDDEQQGNSTREALQALSDLTINELEHLILGALDLSAYRLDAWITSFISRRIKNIRETNKNTLVGAYGWLLDLKPKETSINGGYIHTPSLSQGNTVAVLKSAHMANLNVNDYNMAINLTSERVRRAKFLYGGIKEGQSLDVLIGGLFEKGLQGNYTDTNNNPLTLDGYIYPFRMLYPINISETNEINTNESAATIAARNVVDGKKLLKAWRDQSIPFDDNPDLPSSGTAEYIAIVRELKNIDETLDAMSDLAVSESVYHSVRGNYDRAGHPLEVLSADKRPDEFEVVKTPRSGIAFTHRVMIILSENEEVQSGWKDTLKSISEPNLNGWVSRKLPNPENIKCKYFIGDSTEESDAKILKLVDLHTRDQNISALDFLYLSQSSAKGEETELDLRIKYTIRHKHNLNSDEKITIDFEYKGGVEVNVTSFSAALELARNINNVISNATMINPELLSLPEEVGLPAWNGYSREEVDGYMGRLTELLEHIASKIEEITGFGNSTPFTDEYIKELIDTVIPNLGLDNIRALILFLSELGIINSIPEFIVEDNEIATKTLSDQTIRLIKQLYVRINKCAAKLEEISDYISGDMDDPESNKNSINIISEAFKELLGKSVNVIPFFIAKNSSELSNTFDKNHMKQLLKNDSLAQSVWLQSASSTRERIKQLDLLITLSNILNASNDDCEYKIGQLPYSEDDKWIGLKYENKEALNEKNGVISYIVYAKEQLNFDNAVGGVLVDEFVEMIPSESETTAVAYHYDKPNTEPPNALLLVTPPDLGEDSEKWNWVDLADSVFETLEMTKTRLVDTDALNSIPDDLRNDPSVLNGLGMLLPALFYDINSEKRTGMIAIED